MGGDADFAPIIVGFFFEPSRRVWLFVFFSPLRQLVFVAASVFSLNVCWQGPFLLFLSRGSRPRASNSIFRNPDDN
ncbi:MAG: hypothetical protein CMH56_02595 [Myxococcales bacterium]|nr:hypothetical protein [Myxococcales bacterium]